MTAPTSGGGGAPRRVDRRVLLGIALSALWVGLALTYVGFGVGGALS